MIEIKLARHRLFLTEPEIQSLLAARPDLWATAIRRGKFIQRARAAESRQGKTTAKFKEFKGPP